MLILLKPWQENAELLNVLASFLCGAGQHFRPFSLGRNHKFCQTQTEVIAVVIKLDANTFFQHHVAIEIQHETSTQLYLMSCRYALMPLRYLTKFLEAGVTAMKWRHNCIHVNCIHIF